MKMTKPVFLGFLSVLLFFGCVQEDVRKATEVSFPDQFAVDIPDAISSANGGGLNGRVDGDGDGIIEGNEIYAAVPYFIAVGESSALTLKFVLLVGKQLEIAKIDSLSFPSEEDGRMKKVIINHNVIKGGTDYQYEMLMYDVEDDALGLQLLWNMDPVGGIAVLHPYNINRTENGNIPDALISIEYSEDNPDYEQTMVVSISGLVPENNGDINDLKLFAGRNGDIVDVRGNSNHPNVTIIDPDGGMSRNYAFVGRGDDAKDIGVINLALPPSNITTEEVFADYSVYQVLEDEINAVISLDEATIEGILREAHSPAYFNTTIGFINSGDNVPSGFSDDFINLEGMYPYAPRTVRDLQVDFVR